MHGPPGGSDVARASSLCAPARRRRVVVRPWCRGDGPQGRPLWEGRRLPRRVRPPLHEPALVSHSGTWHGQRRCQGRRPPRRVRPSLLLPLFHGAAGNRRREERLPKRVRPSRSRPPRLGGRPPLATTPWFPTRWLHCWAGKGRGTLLRYCTRGRAGRRGQLGEGRPLHRGGPGAATADGVVVDGVGR